ncbi:MAG: helix-turn-helix transcriptional regulator [Oscillospiraceae bacterium]|nr:helix-turn-helix transcriptional regulator [Oscillospiraceae bacterium]
MTREELMTLCGERLHHVRTQRGLTQSELAELVDVEQNHISHIESGRRMMSLPLLREIAQALCVSTDTLLFEESSSSQIENVIRLLTEQPPQMQTVIEAIVRTCVAEFEKLPECSTS